MGSKASSLELIAEQTGDVFVRVDRKGRTTYVSGSVRQWGYKPSELVGGTGEHLVHPDDLEAFRANTAAAFRGERLDPAGRTHRFRAADGRWVWMEGNPRVVRDRRGRVVELVNVFRDITDRRRAEVAAAAQGELFRSAFEHAGVGKALVALDGGFLDANAALCELLGYSKEALFELDFQTLTHPDDLDADLDLLERLSRGQISTYRMDKRYLTSNGSVVWANLTVTMIRDELGRPKHYVSQVQDQTEQKAMEAALWRKTAEAQAATVAKSEFLANMSHEIRTPLTAIIGFSGLLAGRDDLSEAAHAHVARIAGASEGLLAIVNAVLDFSKLEAGQLTLSPRPTDLDLLMRDTLLMFQLEAEAKSLALAFDAGLGERRFARVDPDRLRQVLINLIGNALKFTEHGEVRLAADYDAAQGRLSVRVADTGPGIGADEQARLFQRFSQIDGSTSRRHGGAGLGLAICKGLVEAMDGEIGVESTPGQGAAFHFTVAAPAAEAAPADGAGVSALAGVQGLRVLVVDDNGANRELARAVLEAFGAEVTLAPGGAAALDELAALPFDLVLLDLRMPDLDGPEVLRRLRATPGPNQSVPALAFTADPLAGPAEKGFDGCIRKPMTPATLLAEIERVTSWADPGAEEAA
jgi:PAS domain S-box-containing protein